MKFLLSWLKEFIIFKFNYNNIYNVFTTLGIDIKNIKKIYPIKYNYNYNIIKGKIIHIVLLKFNYLFIIKTNKNYLKIIYPFFLKKNTKVLIELLNKNKNKIICNSYIKDYIINVNITPNINYLSYYLNLILKIYSYLKFKNYNVKLNYNNLNNKINSKLIKNNILFNDKKILFLKILHIKNNIKKISNFNTQKKNLFNNINLKNYIYDNINLIIKETGIPINIINYDKLKNKNFLIKKNNKDFIFYCNKKLKIKILEKNKDIIIYNNKHPINLSGLINNKNYNINNKTKNILLLIFIYENKKVYKTSIKYNINNKLSKIYKNKINLLNIYYTIKKINLLFNNNIKVLYTYNNINIKYKIIKIYFKTINNYIGIKINKKKILKILYILNYHIIKFNKSYLKIKFNNYMYVKDKIDVINDIIKLYGINNIKSKDNNLFLPLLLKEKENNNNYFEIENIIKNILINHGYYEVINTPFIKKNFFNYDNIIKLKNNYLLKNKLIYNILNNIKYNYYRQKLNLKLFEFGNSYKKDTINKYKEQYRIEILITKKNNKNFIKNLYKLYNLLKIILVKLGIINYKKIILNNNSKIYDIKINILYKNKKIISLGIIKKFLKINQLIFYTVIYLDKLNKILNNKKCIIYKKKNEYLKKDLCFLINKNIYFKHFKKIFKKKYNNKLIKLKLFDIYTKNIPKNKKFYTIRLIINKKLNINKKKIQIILNNLIKLFNYYLNAKLKLFNLK